MTWKELLTSAIQRLEGERIDEAKLNADELALHVLQLQGRSSLRSRLEDEVSNEQVTAFKALLERRVKREPLQYILGEWEFYGLPIYCDPSALIPRPETELLVEQALAEAEKMQGEITVLDLGTGTGAIALAVAKHLPNARVIGLDLSQSAVALAETNRVRLELDNVRFESLDMLSDELVERFAGSVDLLLSNPPYISVAEYEELEPELLHYEPRMSLTDEDNGFRFYDHLAMVAPKLLTDHGRVILELGYNASSHVAKEMEKNGIAQVRIEKDLGGILRVFVGKRV